VREQIPVKPITGAVVGQFRFSDHGFPENLLYLLSLQIIFSD